MAVNLSRKLSDILDLKENDIVKKVLILESRLFEFTLMNLSRLLFQLNFFLILTLKHREFPGRPAVKGRHYHYYDLGYCCGVGFVLAQELSHARAVTKKIK